MGIQKYKLHLIWRISLLCLSFIALAYAIVVLKDIVISVNLLVLIILQVYFLFRLLKSVDKDLANFFDAIEFEDSGMLVVANSEEKLFPELNTKLWKLNKTIHVEKEKAARAHTYLQGLTDHVQSGLLSFDEKGSVKLFNPAARSILGIETPGNISEFHHLSEDLEKAMLELKPSEKKILNLNLRDSEQKSLLLQAMEFKTRTHIEKIISMVDIQNELAGKEIEAWQKMIRVLTHEIMNSVGPVRSSIASMKELLDEPQDEETISDLRVGLDIVAERTQGMAQFAQGFKSLSSLPAPIVEEIHTQSFFSSLQRLFEKEFQEQDITFSMQISPDMESFYADRNLFSQVLINLLKNSVEALTEAENKRIKLKAERNGQTCILQVSDNGSGIPENRMKDIFIPFYTSKTGGTGVGLSLAKQILRMHHGDIKVYSKPFKESLINTCALHTKKLTIVNIVSK